MIIVLWFRLILTLEPSHPSDGNKAKNWEIRFFPFWPLPLNSWLWTGRALDVVFHCFDCNCCCLKVKFTFFNNQNPFQLFLKQYLNIETVETIDRTWFQLIVATLTLLPTHTQTYTDPPPPPPHLPAITDNPCYSFYDAVNFIEEGF